MKWRMPKPCEDCPFNADGPGLHLRESLRPRRWLDILRALRHDGHFICHKTGPSTGDGSKLTCAGAIEWQKKRGLPSQYVRICERLEYFNKQKEERR